MKLYLDELLINQKKDVVLVLHIKHNVHITIFQNKTRDTAMNYGKESCIEIFLNF